MSRLAAAVLCLLALAPAAQDARAHTRSESRASWRIGEDGGAEAVVTASLRESAMLLALFPDEPAAPAILLARHAMTTIALSADGRDCPLTEAPRALAGENDIVRVELRFRCDPPARHSYRIVAEPFLAIAPMHIHLARLRTPSGEYEAVFTERSRDARFAAGVVHETPSVFAAFGTYFLLGVEHILSGVDHLAFVAGVLLICARIGLAIAALTGFTIGHSITLGLAATELVEPDIASVEALIGLTIAIVAIEAGMRAARLRRREADLISVLPLGFAGIAVAAGSQVAPLALAGAALFGACHLALSSRVALGLWLAGATTALFGLIHGFGFANVLIELGLPQGRLVAALAGFNIGVEAGQILVAAPLWFAGHAIASRLGADGTRIAAGASAGLLAALGVFWLVGRSFA